MPNTGCPDADCKKYNSALRDPNNVLLAAEMMSTILRYTILVFCILILCHTKQSIHVVALHIYKKMLTIFLKCFGKDFQKKFSERSFFWHEIFNL